MKPSELKTMVAAMYAAKIPLFIEGSPGVGKSKVVAAAAAELGLQVIDLRVALLDPVDLRGLPMVDKDKGVTRWCPPMFLPLKGMTKGPGIIFADELDKGTTAVQSAMLQGIYDHRFGEAELCPSWSWLAAGNRTKDKAGAHKIITPLANRVCRVSLEADYDEWMRWAETAGISMMVRSYLKYKPHHLSTFDPSKDQTSFASPRSWERMSMTLNANLPSSLIVHAASGLVGDEVGMEFSAFAEVWEKLPDIDAIIRRPADAPIPSRYDTSVHWALAGALATRCKSKNKEVVQAVTTYLMRMDPEYAVFGVREVLAAGAGTINVSTTPGYSAWMAKHKHLFEI